MRTFSLLVPVVALAALAGCSFEVKAGDEPKHPHNQPPPPPAAATPAPAAKPIHTTGSGTVTPTPTPGTVTPTPATNGGTLSTSTPFGGPTASATGFKGSLYFLPAGSTGLPNLGAMAPKTLMYTPTLNIASQAFTSGFPGVDANHSTNFAIRYVAPITVGTESDYNFRVNADDGAVVSIDGTTIVDNSTQHSAMTSKDGPVHLVAGPHVLQVDYFQTTGNVGLQLFCTKSGGSEQICPTTL